MASIAVDPLVLKDVILTLGGTNTYEQHVSSVKFSPKAKITTWQGLTPAAKHSDVTTDWDCAMTAVQDWETTNSLSQYLLEHAGESIAAIFKPRSGSGPTFTATLTIAPPPIGGKVNAFAEDTITHGSTAPVLVPAA